LYPYQLFSWGNYFGELGMFHTCARPATVRCEDSGSLIVIPKTEMQSLLDEFPQYATIWYRESLHREIHRKALLMKFKEPHTYRHLAARSVQEFARGRLIGQRTATSTRHGTGTKMMGDAYAVLDQHSHSTGTKMMDQHSHNPDTKVDLMTIMSHLHGITSRLDALCSDVKFLKQQSTKNEL